METAIRSLLLSATMLLASGPTAHAEDLASRTSLGLNGCAATDIQYSPGGGLAVATCDAPKSIFFSTDNGVHWTFAEGGVYKSGQARDIAITNSGIYTAVGNMLLFTPYSEGSTTGPNWQQLAGGPGQPGVGALAARGDWLLYGTGNAVQVLDSRTNAPVGAPQQFPTVPGYARRIIIGGQYAYALAGDQNGHQRESFFQAFFDSATGTLGAWVNITEAPGLPTSKQTYVWNFSVHPSLGTVYIADRDLTTNPWTNHVYVSTDNGQSFSLLTAMESGPGLGGGCTSFNDSCYTASDPNLFMLGTCVTKDGGTTFSNDITRPIVATEGGQDGACAIHPVRPDEAAFVRTGVGFARLAGLVTKSSYIASDFARAIDGLDGINVYQMAQVPGRKARVLFSSSSGFGYSDDFDSDTPTWAFPVCPRGDCAIFRSAGNVAIDPSNPDVLFVGGFSVRKGVVGGTGTNASIAWTEFARKPDSLQNHGMIGPIVTSSHLPNTLVVGFAVPSGESPTANGVLNFYDMTDGATKKSLFEGKPISAFIALSPTVLFVGVGVEEQTTSVDMRGIYKSTDGGDTWTKATSTVLSEKALVNAFAYDRGRDILYAATGVEGGTDPTAFKTGTVYTLADAVNGGETWRAATLVREQEGTFRSISVDETNGSVYAGVDAKVLVSADFGKSWVTYFTGLLGETMSVVKSDNDSSNVALSARYARAVGPRAAKRLTQGSNVGLNALSAGAGQLPTCRLAVSTKCKSPIKRGASCTLTATLYNALDGSGYPGSKVQFQSSPNGARWKKWLKPKTTNSTGAAVVKSAIEKTTFVRATATAPACTTAAVKITVKKRKK